MPVYGSGGVANAFLQGAIGGASLVHNVRREDRLDEENNLRYQEEKARRDRAEQRAIAAETGARSAKRMAFIAEKYKFNEDAIVQSPEFMAILREDPAFAEERDFLMQNPKVSRAKPLAGLVQFGTQDQKPIYSFQVNVHDEQGRETPKPLSVNRGTDDPVPVFSAKQILAGVGAKLAPFGYQDGSTQLDALAATQPQRPTLRQAAAAAPASAATASTASTPTSQPAGTAVSPAAPQSATAAGSAPSPAPSGPTRVQDMPTVGSAIKAIPGQIADTFNAVDDRLKHRNVASRLTTYASGGVGGAVSRSVNDAARIEKEWHTNRAQLLADPEFSKDVAATLDASFGPGDSVAALGDDAKRITPGVVASEKQQEKLTAKLPSTVPPALQQTAVTSVSQALPPSGRPSRDQLASALILRRAGVISSEQVTRYARTGELDKRELMAVTAGTTVIDKDTGQPVYHTPKEFDPTHRQNALKMSRDASAHYEKVRDGMIKDLNPSSSKFAPKYTSAGFEEYFAESTRELAKLGVAISPEDLAYNPRLMGILTNTYKEAVDKGKPAGWFSEAIKKPLHEALVEKYPPLAQPRPEARTGVIGGKQRQVIMQDGKLYYVD